MRIPFNYISFSGEELDNIKDIINNEEVKPSFIRSCENFISDRFNLSAVFFTNSCTSALEITGLILNLQPEDEIIVPSFTFCSTASAFTRLGCKIRFADSSPDHPNMDISRIKKLITKRTKAIVAVHYGGVACDMQLLTEIGNDFDIPIVEDAAHCINAFHNNNHLGSIGKFGCISFHNTKNIQCFEGGALIVNDQAYVERIRYIIDKGTNKCDFILGKAPFYDWVEQGSSFSMSELHAAVLFPQLINIDHITLRRIKCWELYNNYLKPLKEEGLLNLPQIPAYARHNAHIFYIVLPSEKILIALKDFLNKNGIEANTHYRPLEKSPFIKRTLGTKETLEHSLKFSSTLLRLPLFNSMTDEQVSIVTQLVYEFYKMD